MSELKEIFNGALDDLNKVARQHGFSLRSYEHKGTFYFYPEVEHNFVPLTVKSIGAFKDGGSKAFILYRGKRGVKKVVLYNGISKETHKLCGKYIDFNSFMDRKYRLANLTSEEISALRRFCG